MKTQTTTVGLQRRMINGVVCEDTDNNGRANMLNLINGVVCEDTDNNGRHESEFHYLIILIASSKIVSRPASESVLLILTTLYGIIPPVMGFCLESYSITLET